MLSEVLSPSLEVATALSEGRPVVALESSVWVQGLPWPANYEAALEVESAVRQRGATPAIIWIEDGLVYYGLSPSALEDLCRHPRGSKLNVSDLPLALLRKQPGATTVSATLRAAQWLGLKVFATGGIGGVHRGWQQHLDISSDLGEIARSPVLTVAAGVKCVLDVGATLEALESLAVPVFRVGTDRFPEFYCAGQLTLGQRVDDAAEVARASRLSRELLGRAGLAVRETPHPLPRDQVMTWLEQGLQQAPPVGKEVTPFLLGYLGKASQGETTRVNRELLVANAQLAADIAQYL